MILSKSMEILFRAVPPSVNLALAGTDPEEKHERYQLMTPHGISELEAAMRLADRMDRSRGLEPMSFENLFSSAIVHQPER